MKYTKWAPIVGGRLEPGETIEFGVVGSIGQGPSVKRQVATTAIVAVASLGTVAAAAVKRPSAFVLTNKRLLAFRTGFNGDRPTDQLVGWLARGSFRFELVSSGLKRHYELTSQDGSSVPVTFGINNAKDGDELARLSNG